MSLACYGGIAGALLALAGFVVLWVQHPGMSRATLAETYWPLSILFLVCAAVATLARLAGGSE